MCSLSSCIQLCGCGTSFRSTAKMSVFRAIIITFLVSLLSRYVACQGTSSVPGNVDTAVQNQSNPQIQQLQPPTGSTSSFPPESQSQPAQPAPDSTLMGGTFVPSCHIACELVDPVENMPQNTGATTDIRTSSSFNPSLEALQVIDPFDRYSSRKRFQSVPYRNRFDRFRFGEYGNPRFGLGYRRPHIPYPVFDETADDMADDLPVDDVAVIVQPTIKRQPQAEITGTLGTEPKLYRCQKVCS